jgi:hypothetical protein
MTVATGLRVLDYGDHALLLHFDSTAEVLPWADALRDADLLGVVDLVSASRTVLIKVESRRYLPLIRQHIEELHAEPSYAVEPPAVGWHRTALSVPRLRYLAERYGPQWTHLADRRTPDPDLPPSRSSNADGMLGAAHC